MTEKLSKEAVVDLVTMKLTENMFDAETREKIQKTSLKSIVERGVRSLAAEVVEVVLTNSRLESTQTDRALTNICKFAVEWRLGNADGANSMNVIFHILKEMGYTDVD